MTSTGPGRARRSSNGLAVVLVATLVVVVVGVVTVLLVRQDSGAPAVKAVAACPSGSGVTAELDVVAAERATTSQLERAGDLLRQRLGTYGCADVQVVAGRLHVSASRTAVAHLDPLLAPGRLQLREVLEAVPGTGCPISAQATSAYEVMTACSQDGSEKFRLGPAKVVGTDVRGAQAQRDQLGEWQILLTFTADGQRRFADLTSQLIRKRLAIVLDGVVISAPSIQERIDGPAQISGSFTKDSAAALTVLLQRGPLPVALRRA